MHRGMHRTGLVLLMMGMVLVVYALNLISSWEPPQLLAWMKDHGAVIGGGILLLLGGIWLAWDGVKRD